MLQFNFTPFPVLETKRLLLRRLEKSDVRSVFKLRSDPETMQYIPRPLVANDEEALQHIALIDERIVSNEGINWAIALRENPQQMIGIVGHYRIKPQDFRSEIGYMLLPEFSGKGIATEAVAAAVDYGFDTMGLNSVEGVIDPENGASAKVLEKNGFVQEAHFKEYEFYDGKFMDSVIYSLLKKNRKRA